MSPIKVAPYGSWESPIQPENFGTDSVFIDQINVNKSNGKVYVVEERPAEGGRAVIVEHHNGRARDVLPQKYSARAQVHEYGGGPFVVRERDGHIIFTDQATKNVFDLDPVTTEARPLLSENTKLYYADFETDPTNAEWIVAVREDHQASDGEAENTLAAIHASSGAVTVIVRGCDFYSSPRFSPDGKKLCWVQWNHPNMPWEATQLWAGDWHDGQVSNATCIAGQDEPSSVMEPTWNAKGALYFTDDKSGFLQIYEFQHGVVRHVQLDGLEDAEFGVPVWVFGASTYTFLTPETLVALYTQNGGIATIVVDVPRRTYRDLGCHINDIYSSAIKAVDSTTVALIGATATAPRLLTLVDVTQGGLGKVLKRSIGAPISDDYISEVRSISFPRIHGPGGGDAYGLFFPPKNPLYTAPEGTLPPLIVAIHGGPTMQMGAGFSLRDQSLTTRGYALLQVNFVGSSGYGKAYRHLLNGQWGISDVADAVSGVDYLASRGWIDRKRVGITGHSGGGYATMQGMALYPDIWATGVSESGISDMALLVAETHKFESHYLNSLCWSPGTSQEETARILLDRSPITRADQIKKPILVINGSNDPIIPPNQARDFVEKVTAGGGIAEAVIYDGEGHSFAKATTVVDIERRRYAWFQKYLVDPQL